MNLWKNYKVLYQGIYHTLWLSMISTGNQQFFSGDVHIHDISIVQLCMKNLLYSTGCLFRKSENLTKNTNIWFRNEVLRSDSTRESQMGFSTLPTPHGMIQYQCLTDRALGKRSFSLARNSTMLMFLFIMCEGLPLWCTKIPQHWFWQLTRLCSKF